MMNSPAVNQKRTQTTLNINQTLYNFKFYHQRGINSELLSRCDAGSLPNHFLTWYDDC